MVGGEAGSCSKTPVGLLGPSSQHLMKDRRNRESLAPPLQGDGVPDKFCFGDKILDKERLGSQSCGLG